MKLTWVQILKRVAVTAFALTLFLGVVLALEIRSLTRVSEPAPGFAVGTRTALVVLDVQEEYTGSAASAPFPYANAEALIERINLLATQSAAAGVDVVYVRQIYSSKLAQLVSLLLLDKRGWPGSPGAELDQRLQRGSAAVLQKPHADAFSSEQFRDFMTQHQIGRVWLVGLDGGGCVDATARGARAHGLTAGIVQDAVASLEPNALAEKRQDYAALGITLESSQTLFATGLSGAF